MSEPITKPRVSAAAKIALVLAAAAVLLAVFALAAPGSRFFFPLVSLWCNLALFACVLLVLRVAGIKFDLFHKAVILGLWAAALLYFFWALDRRSFVYIWDYFNHINLRLRLSNLSLNLVLFLVLGVVIVSGLGLVLV